MKRLTAVNNRFVSVVILVGAAVLATSAWELVTRPVNALGITLLVMTVLGGWATLRIPSMPISFSISDTFNIVAALLVGPAAGAINAAADGLVLSYRMAKSKRTPGRVLFNMATPAIATWLAAHAFFAFAGGRPLIDGPAGVVRLAGLMAIFGVLNFGLNTGMVAIAVGLETGERAYATWKQHFSGLWVTFFGGVTAAMLMLALSNRGALEVLLLILPLPVLLHVTFRHALGRAEDKIGHLDSLNKVYVATIEALAQAIDAKDQVTHDHIRRVQERSIRVARRLGVTDDAIIQAIKAASLLHDVGKIAIPEHILNKPGKLTPPEFEIMKRHAPIGSDILSLIGFPYPVAPIVRHHHENWDGTGYPDGIAGEQIPIGARILMVVDCFDALTSDRPYRPRIDDRAALIVLADRKGTMYDPNVVDTFFKMYEEGGFVDDGSHQAPAPALADVTATIPTLVGRTTSPEAAAASEDSDLEIFYALGRALRQPAGETELATILWRHLQRSVPASAFVLFAYDPATDGLLPVWQGGTPVHPARTRIPLGERVSGWVAATGSPIVNAEARLDLDEQAREGSSLRSALLVPIMAAGRATGVLAFYSDQPRAFDEHHRRLGQAAARIAAEHLSVAVAVG